MDKLARKIVRLAYEKPELRRHLLPLLTDEVRVVKASDAFNKAVGDKTVRSPDTGRDVKIKSLAGGGEKSKALYKKLRKEWSDKNDGGGKDKDPKNLQGKAKDLSSGGGDALQVLKSIGGSKTEKAMSYIKSVAKELSSLGGPQFKSKMKTLGDMSSSIKSKGEKGQLDSTMIQGYITTLKDLTETVENMGRDVRDSERDGLSSKTQDAIDGLFEEEIDPLIDALSKLKKMV